jgi:polar amino acid transport system substrate-binding protein
MRTIRPSRLTAKMFLGSLLALAVVGCSSASSTAGAGTNPNANVNAPQAMLGGDGSFARVQTDGIKICTTNDAPYNVKDANGKFVGLDADIINEALTRLKLTNVSYVEGPWDSMVPNLQSKRCDFLQTNIHYNATRAAIIGFTAPVYFYADSLVVKKGNPLNLHTWEALAGHSSSAMLGDNYVDWLNKRGDLSAIKTYKTWPELIADVENGRVDSAIVDESVAGYYITGHPDSNIELATGYIPQTDLSDYTRYGVPMGYNDLANAFSSVLDGMRVDGTLATIIAKYGLAPHAFQVYKGMK